jgi:hypothetical protein
MGFIYAAAQLTIVAASGKDSSAGLPGVTQARPAARIQELGPLMLIPHLTSGLAEIQRSVWATRAWTFQEGFLSRRRLFFTDKQAVYIYTTSIHFDNEHGVVPDSDARTRRPGPLMSLLPSDQNHRVVPWDEYVLQPAMALIEEYSKRSLSYDSDALNAIVGALNTLTSLLHPIYHILGVPFIERKHDGFASDERGYLIREPSIQVAMFWYHKQPSRRRPGFPSW